LIFVVWQTTNEDILTTFKLSTTELTQLTVPTISFNSS